MMATIYLDELLRDILPFTNLLTIGLITIIIWLIKWWADKVDARLDKLEGKEE
jgi:hypothetical protein